MARIIRAFATRYWSLLEKVSNFSLRTANIPIEQLILGIVNWSTRLRMKNLGLGAPKSVSEVSEAAALEQVSFRSLLL
jgi:hypothetical protein